MLTRLGYGVFTATDGRRAIDVFSDHADEFACVILDLTMPRMDGEQTFQELRRIHPDVKVVIASGYTEQDVTQRLVGEDLAGFIQKPYQRRTLAAVLTRPWPAALARRAEEHLLADRHRDTSGLMMS